jgi:hypothetical protein
VAIFASSSALFFSCFVIPGERSFGTQLALSTEALSSGQNCKPSGGLLVLGE